MTDEPPGPEPGFWPGIINAGLLVLSVIMVVVAFAGWWPF